MQLRDYQEPLIKLTREALAIYKSIILCAPCGAGKTTLSSFILNGALQKGKRAYFCVHRRQLIQQVRKELDKQGIPHGVIAAKYPRTTHPIQICMQQSYVRREVPPAELLIIDECHLQPDTYKKIIDVSPEAFIIGLSATPELLSGKPLSAFKYKVETIDTAYLISIGALSAFKYYAPTDMDFSKVPSLGGDYREEAVSEIVEKSSLIGDSIHHYEKYGNGGRFLNFSYNVKHSIRTAEAFTKAGYPCIHVDAETPDDIRLDAMNKLVRKEISGISNCALYTEGTDLPALEVLIKQRPTKSAMRNRQMDGRVLRSFPSKQFGVIIDMVNNYKTLQQLPDTPIEWAWQGRVKKKSKVAEKIDALCTCTKCFSVFSGNKDICPECGAGRVRKERKIEEKAGELSEIVIAEQKKQDKMEIGRANTLEEYIAIGKARGYKPGWARIRWQLKQKYRTRSAN